MSQDTPTLHMVCGKIASGKSKLTAALGRKPQTVVLSEDDWLGALFAEQMSTIADYVHFSGRLKGVMGPHVVGLLKAGVSVALDFPANTVEMRRWMRDLLDQSQAAHVLHVLDVPDEVCLERLRIRNAKGAHPFSVTDEQFTQVTRHYAPPTPNEGFAIETHRWNGAAD